MKVELLDDAGNPVDEMKDVPIVEGKLTAALDNLVQAYKNHGCGGRMMKATPSTEELEKTICRDLSVYAKIRRDGTMTWDQKDKFFTYFEPAA